MGVFRATWVAAIAASASLGCPAVLEPVGGADPDDPAGPDAGAPEEPDEPDPASSSFVLYSHYTGTCSFFELERICTADYNRELFRADFDVKTGLVRTTRLTRNSDGLAPRDFRDSPDDDFFHAVDTWSGVLYFSNATSGSRDIYRMAADGTGEPVRLTDPADDDEFLALSTDGQTLFYLSDRDGDVDVFARPASGAGEPTNLTPEDGDAGQVVAVVPEDRGFVLRVGLAPNDPDGTDADYELYLLAPDGQTVRLTGDRVADTLELVSRDGRYVYFTRMDDANNDGVAEAGKNLWVVPTDGLGDPRRLTSFTDGSLSVQALTPDGGRVIFQHRPDGGSSQVFSLATTGGIPVQLSDSTPGDSAFFRILSPSGRHVFYTRRDREDGVGDIEIYRVDTAGGEPLLVTDFDNETYFFPRAVLEEQGQLLYQGPVDGDSDLFVTGMSGGSHVDLTDNDVTDLFEAVSPDGAYLVYSNLSASVNEDGTYAPSPDLDLYLVRTDGGGSVLTLSDNAYLDTFEALVVAGPGARRVVTAADPRRSSSSAVGR